LASKDGPRGSFPARASRNILLDMPADTIPTDPIRVVLVDLKKLPQEIVRAVLEQKGDIRVVAQFDPPASLRAAFDEADGDVVIADEDRVEDEVRQFLKAHPGVGVLAVGDDGRRASLWLGQSSLRTLLKAVRTLLKAVRA
jgi:DNA-binding NarL/FixJ family response regulator